MAYQTNFDYPLIAPAFIGGMGGPNGKTFFVNPSGGGADDVDVPWWNVDEARCFSTLQAAINACVASRGDTIYVKRGGMSVTSQVNFNKAGIRVIAQRWGMSPQFRGEYSAIYSTTITDGPVAQITDSCYIEGLGFAGADADSDFYAGAALLIGGEATAEPYGVHLRQCRFPKWNLDNSKGVSIEGSSDCLLEECYFEGVGADFDAGIYVQGATQNLEIKDCRFRDCTYGIQFGAFAGGGPHCLILQNFFEDAKILSAASAATGLVAGNYSEGATDTGSYSATVDTLNGYGLVFSDNHYAE